jgi:hypothetical protein
MPIPESAVSYSQSVLLRRLGRPFEFNSKAVKFPIVSGGRGTCRFRTGKSRDASAIPPPAEIGCPQRKVFSCITLIGVLLWISE